MVTGEKLSIGDRFITGVAMFIPIVNGKALREGTKLAAEGAEIIAKHGDEAVDIVRHSDDILDSTRAGEKATGKLTPEQLANKPKYAPDTVKWENKDGKIELDDNGTWTYHDWEGNSVSYPDGYPDFKSAGMVKQEVTIGEFESYPKDFSKADELNPDGPINRLEDTYHHHQDLTTMQQINKILHQRFTHKGGMSVSKRERG